MAIEVSEQWKSAISAQFRRQGYLRVTLEIVPPEIDQGTTIETESESIGNTSVQSLLGNMTRPQEAFATFEPDYWDSHGHKYIYDDDGLQNPQMLWTSKVLSSEEDISFTFTFTDVVSLPGLTVNWDTITLSYPKKVDFLLEKSDGDVAEQSVYNNSAVSTFAGIFDNIVGFTMTIPKGMWSIPERRVRIQSFAMGLMIEIDPQINMSATEYEKISITGASLPRSTYTINVQNIVASIGGQVTLKPNDNLSNAAALNPIQPLAAALNHEYDTPAELRDARELIATFEVNYWGTSGEWTVIEPNSDLNSPFGWASVGVYWPTDGSFSAPRETEYEKWNEQAPIVLGLKLAAISNIDELEIIWDSLLGTYPTEWVFRCYDIYDYEIFSQEYLPPLIDDRWVSSFKEMNIIYVARIEIEIRKWSHPGWRARIDSLKIASSWDFGENFTETNDFFDPMLERGYSKYLARRQRTYWQWGFMLNPQGDIEWMPPLTRYLDGWNIPADSISATFTCTSRLDLMTSTYYFGELPDETGISLYDLAVQIIQRGSVIKEYDTELPIVIDDSLQDIYTTAPAPMIQENVILQYIAGCTGMILKCDPVTQYIQIQPEGDFTDYTIGRAQQLENPSVSISNELKMIKVHVYNYFVNESLDKQELFNGTVTMRSTNEYTIAFSALAGDVEVEINAPSNVNVQDIKIYAGCCIIKTHVFLEILGKAMFSVDVPIVVKGRPIQSAYNIIQTYYNPDAKNGEIVTINNPLITSNSMAQLVTDATIKWYLNRHTLKFKYLGIPELRAGDTAAIYSKYSNSIGLLTETSLSFNGGWSGSLTTELHVNADDDTEVIP